MGYSKTVASNSLILYPNITNEQEISTAGCVGGAGMSIINIPDFDGELLYANLSYNANMMRNTSVATNWFHDFEIEISPDSGVNWYTALSGFAPMLRISASSNVFGLFTFCSGTDIKSYVVRGGTLQVRYKSPTTHTEGDSIFIYSAFTSLELVFR